MKTMKKGDTIEVSKFIRPDDICQLLGCSRSTAYQMIRQLNQELAAKGIITVSGRVSRRYFMERMYV